MSAPLAYIGLVDKRGYVRNYVPITADVVFIGERKPALVRIHHPDVLPLHLRIQWSSRDGTIKPYLRAIGPGCIFNDSVLRPTEERVLEDGTNFFLAGYHMIFSLQQTATEIRRKAGESSSSAPVAASNAPTTTKKPKKVESSDSLPNSTPPVASSSNAAPKPPTQRLLDQSVDSDSVNASTTSILSFAPTDLDSSQTLLHSIDEPLDSSSQISNNSSLPLESSQQSISATPTTNLESAETEHPTEKKVKKAFPKGQEKALRLSLEAEYHARKLGGPLPSTERRRRPTTSIHRQLTQRISRSKEPISSATLTAVETNIDAMDVDYLPDPSPPVNPVVAEEDTGLNGANAQSEPEEGREETTFETSSHPSTEVSKLVDPVVADGDARINGAIEQGVPEEEREETTFEMASQQSTEVSTLAEPVFVEERDQMNQALEQEVPEEVEVEAKSEMAIQQSIDVSKLVDPIIVEESMQMNEVMEQGVPEGVEEEAKSEMSSQQSTEVSKSIDPVFAEECVPMNQMVDQEVPEEVQEETKSEYATQQSAETSKSQRALQEMLESAQYMLEKNGGLSRRTRHSLGEYSYIPSTSDNASRSKRRKSMDSTRYKAENPVTPKPTKKRKSVESDLSSVTDKSSGNEISSPLPSEILVHVSPAVEAVMEVNGDLNQSVDSYLERSSMDLSVTENGSPFSSQVSMGSAAASSQEAEPTKNRRSSRSRSPRTASAQETPKLRARGEVPEGQSLEEIVEKLKRKKHTSQDAYQEYKHYQRLLVQQTLELEAARQAEMHEAQRAKSTARRSNGQKARNEYVKMLISGSAKKLRPPKERSPASGRSSPKSLSSAASPSSSQQDDDDYLPNGPYAIDNDSTPPLRSSQTPRKSRYSAVPTRLKPLLDDSISAEQKQKIEENEDPETMMRFYEEMARDNASYYMDYKSWSLKVEQEMKENEKAKMEEAAIQASKKRPPKPKSRAAPKRAAAPKTSTIAKPTPVAKRSKAATPTKQQASQVSATVASHHPAPYSHLPPIQLDGADVVTPTPTVTAQSSRQIITTTINNKVTRLSVLSPTPQEIIASKSAVNLKKRPREEEAPEDNQLTPEPKKVFNFDFDLD